MNTTVILGKDEDPSIINKFRKLNFKLIYDGYYSVLIVAITLFLKTCFLIYLFL